jgi:hypothetical protein
MGVGAGVVQVEVLWMTTSFPQNIQCAVCGASSTHTVLGSSNTMGGADMDTRPSAMLRYALDMSIQRCPTCNYWARRIPNSSAKAGQLVRSPEYQALLNDKELPELTASFMCASMLAEAEGDLRVAAWHSIEVAWASDDDYSGRQPWPRPAPSADRPWPPEPASALRCRGAAVRLIRLLVSRGGSISEQAGGDNALLADLLRRVGEMQAAQAECERGLSADPDEVIGQVLRFEKLQAALGDTSAHSIPAAVEWALSTA